MLDRVFSTPRLEFLKVLTDLLKELFQTAPVDKFIAQVPQRPVKNAIFRC